MKNPETTARVQERLIERLRIEPCDSDAPLPTCRENWPNGPDSWCDGCLMLAAADAVDASQARAAALAQERDETFEAMREMTNAAHDFADKADASQATLAQVTAERDEARELLGLAAMRINCAGPVHERIDVLRGQLTEQLEAAQRERDAANQSREMISQHWHAIAAEIRIPSQGIDETVTERARRMRQRMEGAEEKVRALEAALREILGMIAALSIRSGVVCAIEQIASEAVSPDTGKETQP
jgi:chromosome segregation ATPase